MSTMDEEGGRSLSGSKQWDNELNIFMGKETGGKVGEIGAEKKRHKRKKPMEREYLGGCRQSWTKKNEGNGGAVFTKKRDEPNPIGRTGRELPTKNKQT